jgi:hypothetical protein
MRNKVKQDRTDEQHQAEEQESQLDIDWEKIEKHLDIPELSKHRERIKRKASQVRLWRLMSEGKWDEFAREWDNSPDKKSLDKKLNAAVDREFHNASWQKVVEASGQGKKCGVALRIASLYKRLDPQDGVESALAPVMISLTEVITECFRRASISSASEVRDIELNHAAKGALVLAALTKAFDSHRERFCFPKKKE